MLAELGRADEAEAVLDRLLKLAPGHAGAHYNLAVLLARRGEHGGALEHYERALAADPQHQGARLNRATLRLAMRDAEGALEDFGKVADPAESVAGRTKALLLLHRDAEALEHLEQHRSFPEAARLRGVALASLGRLEEAHAVLGASARAVYIDRALERQNVCDWHDRGRLVDTVREAIAAPRPGELSGLGVLLYVHALPLSGQELKRVGGRVGERLRVEAAQLGGQAALAPMNATRLRIGFLSSGLRNHPEARLLRHVLEKRDRQRFEYFVYALNADDGSAFRAAVVGAADRFADLSSSSSGEIVRKLRTDRLDLLVDLSANLEGARPHVLAARLAPVQANFVGPPCTLGSGILDYRVSDAIVTPPAHQDDWHERLVLLPAPHWTYDSDQPIGQAHTRALHGLPERGFVYCGFHQPFKICPTIFALWMRLLKQVPGSVLWLLDWGALVRANLAREAERAGVEASRLIFASRTSDLEFHLGRQRLADLFLDTLHYGAHTTAADALHVGLPVLTCPGDTMASRICGSLVRGAGIDDMVVDSLEAYESKALALARVPGMLDDVKARLRQARASAPFFALPDRVRALESAFVAMVERQRAGLPPDTLVVD